MSLGIARTMEEVCARNAQVEAENRELRQQFEHSQSTIDHLIKHFAIRGDRERQKELDNQSKLDGILQELKSMKKAVDALRSEASAGNSRREKPCGSPEGDLLSLEADDATLDLVETQPPLENSKPTPDHGTGGGFPSTASPPKDPIPVELPRPYRPEQSARRKEYGNRRNLTGDGGSWCEQALWYREGEKDASAWRTVVITNVPSNASFADIMDRVRDGPIVKASFMPTASMKTTPAFGDTNSAMITFAFRDCAVQFIKDCESQKRDMMFWSEKEQAAVEASVKMVPTISRPNNPFTLDALRAGTFSRSLCVQDLQDWVPATLAEAVVTHHDGVTLRAIKAYRDDRSGLVILEFGSIRDSKSARDVIQENMAYLRGIQMVDYFPDLCSHQVETVDDRGAARSDLGTGTLTDNKQDRAEKGKPGEEVES